MKFIADRTVSSTDPSSTLSFKMPPFDCVCEESAEQKAKQEEEETVKPSR